MGMLADTFDHKGVTSVGQKWTNVAQSMVINLAIEVYEVGVYRFSFAVYDADAAISAVVERMSDDGYGVPSKGRSSLAPFVAVLKLTGMTVPPKSFTGCIVTGSTRANIPECSPCHRSPA